ncbi:DUF3788 domain-containing protein [Paenibacillus sp. M1]|uniref:DUF3788 domain-containing protein n=1 Tax=Paenibacillus haidiansis TaxID=1574488 RepID=A0ABU7VR35_9BACL
MNYTRMLDKLAVPTMEDIYTFMGDKATEAWVDLEKFLEDNYDFSPEIVFGGKNYGWCVRYRRSGKTLTAIHPESGAFTILIVLGKKEAEEALSCLEQFSKEMASLIMDTDQLHDGKWLWIRVLSSESNEDIKKLLMIKKKPKKKTA